MSAGHRHTDRPESWIYKWPKVRIFPRFGHLRRIGQTMSGGSGNRARSPAGGRAFLRLTSQAHAVRSWMVTNDPTEPHALPDPQDKPEENQDILETMEAIIEVLKEQGLGSGKSCHAALATAMSMIAPPGLEQTDPGESSGNPEHDLINSSINPVIEKVASLTDDPRLAVSVLIGGSLIILNQAMRSAEAAVEDGKE